MLVPVSALLVCEWIKIVSNHSRSLIPSAEIKPASNVASFLLIRRTCCPVLINLWNKLPHPLGLNKFFRRWGPLNSSGRGQMSPFCCRQSAKSWANFFPIRAFSASKLLLERISSRIAFRSELVSIEIELLDAWFSILWLYEHNAWK